MCIFSKNNERLYKLYNGLIKLIVRVDYLNKKTLDDTKYITLQYI